MRFFFHPFCAVSSPNQVLCPWSGFDTWLQWAHHEKWKSIILPIMATRVSFSLDNGLLLYIKDTKQTVIIWASHETCPDDKEKFVSLCWCSFLSTSLIVIYFAKKSLRLEEKTFLISVRDGGHFVRGICACFTYNLILTEQGTLGFQRSPGEIVFLKLSVRVGKLCFCLEFWFTGFKEHKGAQTKAVFW